MVGLAHISLAQQIGDTCVFPEMDKVQLSEHQAGPMSEQLNSSKSTHKHINGILKMKIIRISKSRRYPMGCVPTFYRGRRDLKKQSKVIL